MNEKTVLTIALAGVGEVARELHIPAIANSSAWELVATCSRYGSIPGIESFTEIEHMLVSRPDIQVVSLCQPPAPRLHYAITALQHDRHVMLEKPPAASLTSCLALEATARARKLSLFASWHSQQADMVNTARNWLCDKRLLRLHIRWREDVRRWHAGQEWIWEPGGFGVFDPGINALSILTKILPKPVYLMSAELAVPENKQTPIAADLVFGHPDGATVTAEFDWREQGEQSWSIEIETDSGSMQLDNGGSQLSINGQNYQNTESYLTSGDDEAVNTLSSEYARLYKRMRHLVQQRQTDVDLAPLRLVADAFLIGKRTVTEPFYE